MNFGPARAAVALVTSLLIGCASIDTPSEIAEATPSQPEPSTAPVQTASADRNDPEAIVCKRFESTGSRLKKEKVCLPNKEWTKQAEAAEHYLDGVQRGSSNQPGGESLPVGQ